MESEGLSWLWAVAVIGGPVVLGVVLAIVLWRRRRARKRDQRVQRSGSADQRDWCSQDRRAGNDLLDRPASESAGPTQAWIRRGAHHQSPL